MSILFILLHYIFNQWKVPAILLFYKKINSATWKEQKNLLFAFIFHRTTCKIVTFFVNASRSGEKLKKGTFLEKKGGYFKLSGENILTSILSAFHPFLTLPNDDLKRERGTFLSLSSDLMKGAKRYLFCSWKRCSHNQKREKGTFFTVESDVVKSARKVPF